MDLLLGLQRFIIKLHFIQKSVVNKNFKLYLCPPIFWGIVLF